LVYLDASCVIPILIPEASSARVEKAVISLGGDRATVSLWTLLECSSAVARLVRMRALAADSARSVLETLDRMVGESFRLLVPDRYDFNTAREMIAQSRWQLRGGDALHLAIARNHKAERMLTLDAGIIRIAERVGVSVTSVGI
jgi:predicted nucleic acid-binding protein